MRRNFEKDRSAVATVTGKVRNMSRADTTSVNVEVSAALSTISRWARSFTDDSWAISDLNDDASVTSCTGNASLRSQLYSFCKAVACDTMSCSGMDDKTLGKMTENFAAILFIAVNRWVSCDVIPCQSRSWTPWFGSAVLRSSSVHVSSAISLKWSFFFATRMSWNLGSTPQRRQNLSTTMHSLQLCRETILGGWHKPPDPCGPTCAAGSAGALVTPLAGCYIWYSEEATGRGVVPPVPSSLYQI